MLHFQIHSPKKPFFNYLFPGLNYLLTLSQFGVHLLHGTHCGFTFGSSGSGNKVDASTKSCLPENSMDTWYESGTSVVSISPFTVVSVYLSIFSFLSR
jgi:hypothetical protein